MFRRIFYNFSYFRHPPWDTGIVPPELVDFVTAKPPGKALDLGCGTGTNSLYLAAHGWDVTAIDFARRAISQARKKAAAVNAQVNWRLGDVTNLDDLNCCFDLILDIGCFHSLTPQQKERYIQNIERLLAPAGTFLLYGFIRTPPATIGIDSNDFSRLQEQLRIIHQKLGSDHQRSSCWLTITR